MPFDPRIIKILLMVLIFASHGVTGSWADSQAESLVPSPVDSSRGLPLERAVTYRSMTMGTWASVTIVTSDSTASARDAKRARREFERVDSLMSNWTEVSEVARINREAARSPVRIHSEVAAVISEAILVGRESGGAFDITVEPLVRLWGFLGGSPHVPSAKDVEATRARVGLDQLLFEPATETLRFKKPGVAIDLGGIAKGYGVDAAARALSTSGVAAALVDLSGNMAPLGSPPGGTGWMIGLRDPEGRVPYLARIRLRDRCIATSGNYEQLVEADGREYGHILDPRTGWPAEGLSSVTVLAPTALEADAWDTALFVMGPERAKRKAKERVELGVVLIQPSRSGPDTVWVEEELRGIFELEEDPSGNFELTYF